MNALCYRLGIRVPQGFNLEDRDYRSFDYPVIVKPRVKIDTLGASKCSYIKDSITLHNYLARLKERDIHVSKLVCQKAIEGDNRWEYGYGGFFISGTPIVDIAFYQFRQYPQGLCCYAREMTDVVLYNDVASFVKPIVMELKYSGLIEFDLKRYSKTKRLFLLDINPRPWRSADMLSVKIGDSTVFSPQVSKKCVEWRYPIKELFSFRNSNNVSYAVCKAITGNDCFIKYKALYDKSDNKPYRIQLRRDIKTMLNSFFRHIK